MLLKKKLILFKIKYNGAGASFAKMLFVLKKK
jgi:hypothetical protein